MSTCKIVSLLLALSVTAVSSQSFPFVLNVTSISGNETLGEIHLYYRVSAILNGNIGDVCSSSGVTDQVANELCRQELIDEGSGFLRVTGAVATPPYNFINGELFSTSYANFACPSDITACTGMQVSNCTGYGGFLTIRCNIRFPECFPGLTILNNVVNSTTPDGAFYETGYPAICTNDARYAPVCSGASLSPRDVSELCLRNIENPFAFFGGFVGAPDGVTALPIDFFREIDVVVTDLSCTTLLNCTNVTMMGKCPNDDYATITCQQVCNDETYQPMLYNNYTTTRDGVTYFAGIFQFCLGGTFARICDDGTNVQDLATIGCIQYGYQAGRMLPYNASLYNGSPRGILYFSNYTCNEFGCAQNISFAFNEQCYNNGQKDVTVECYNNSLSCSTEGNVTFYTRISSVINGDTEITTGVAVICTNGQYTALCGDTEDFDTDDAANVCQAMGILVVLCVLLIHCMVLLLLHQGITVMLLV
ncbi:PREDICTED: uncharacterized protein LOC109583464 [Amphimedon queenslandica]|uniref:SRCR domain-containing protein n=1 Tax=Amphimedon queenslandica TaxID=400682 RepID=A0A1X7UHB2_AMPQE|nr:PREDICTED: uncharacterized protein LOC109583464 [Amphimedon queenslandica]XP_019854395.1 PREDICTED: uncharacterized protein LOC109583464 [Amphimedon queenslandica]|eukprot:XP_019854394.1 PREDICTED: uncharacterized protein LOC109583464 [Amphimedon queenslandica]